MSVLQSAQKQEIPAFQTDDDSCPQCKSERYLNNGMRLLVGPCYHRICESCVQQIFDAGPAPCPECRRILRKAEFYQPIFEDLTVENEVRIRMRMAATYNKREEDFKSLKDYNTYLEMVEDLTFRLLYDINTDEAEYLIEKYKRDNTASIEKNQSKFRREEQLQQLISNQERIKHQQQREEYLKQLEEEKREKEVAKYNLINALATSDKDAKDIVKANMVHLKKSSLSNRSATQKPRLDIEALLRNVGGDFDDEDIEEEDEYAPFDPAESPYEPMDVELRSRYDDPNPAFRQGNTLAAAGMTREVHQRYVIEGAIAGLFAQPLHEDMVDAEATEANFRSAESPNS
ncbi:TFIIH/NER complex subunit [Coemansia spiralis]|uniref:RNA polymerase II transcription factor B subunit 3 n=2 Tax=Coemansia TaxID=4863 RepID=A0A9W8G5X9_9FUNG|nr:CDK-activating kinase assembly factor MAT1-domain-containing protein [Coemansia spiralis]KAJ1991482.1 TFIIH/NER complex subunit [Coemansia umbellata]KAJ2621564.1 TFIIH/NER complex subunit [Coemansia sp. RSA 1358]KAJ2676713.1 TFIIH/NER complex subunit [Coemansia spiralis]